MAHSPSAYDRGTHHTNYSSIHSADAFVGDYQVMYTPGTSPQPARTSRKSTRFTRPNGSIRNATVTQSYVLPANMPNTSQIGPDNGGVLPNVQVRYTIPADEKQIVASLRTLQGDLNDAMKTIRSLTRERDDAMHELRVLRAASRKSTTPRKERATPRVEEALFDLSRLEESPKKTPARQAAAKKVSIARNQNSLPPSQEARNLAHMSGAINKATEGGRFESRYKRPVVEDPDQSIVEDPTAASNTSRRRRHQLDENMTSAYILPDITVAQPVTTNHQVSREAQQILHSHDPRHLAVCEVCRRLVEKPQAPEFTAKITELMNATSLEDPTLRPKISPILALANVKTLLKSQFDHAKQKHQEAWEQYDAIPAPLTSKKHDRISNELLYWQRKMEEFRSLLDNLRDVEEGIAGVEV